MIMIIVKLMNKMIKNKIIMNKMSIVKMIMNKMSIVNSLTLEASIVQGSSTRQCGNRKRKQNPRGQEEDGRDHS